MKLTRRNYPSYESSIQLVLGCLIYLGIAFFCACSSNRSTNSVNRAPYNPTDPLPVDNAVDQSLDLTLSWNASDPDGDSLKFDVYLSGLNPPVTTIVTDRNVKYMPVAGLYEGSTYYWKIVAKDPSGKTNASSPIWRFTTFSNPTIWRTRAHMPTARIALAAAQYEGRIYAIGGLASTGVLATVEMFDPVTNTWTTRAPMPTPRAYLVAVTVGHAIYAIGGESGSRVYQTVEEYNPLTNSWRERAPMPDSAARFAACFINNKVYVFGGEIRGSIEEDGVFEYDPITNAWTIRNSMPTGRGAHAVATYGGKAYLFGGSTTDFDFVAFADQYDPTSGVFSPSHSMPTARRDMMAESFGSKIHVIGGWSVTGQHNFYALNEVYDPATDSWQEGTPMSVARHNLATAVVFGKLYAIGGLAIGPPSILDLVEEYDPSLDTLIH